MEEESCLLVAEDLDPMLNQSDYKHRDVGGCQYRQKAILPQAKRNRREANSGTVANCLRHDKGETRRSKKEKKPNFGGHCGHLVIRVR